MAIDNLLGSTRRVVEETEPLNNCRGVTYRVVNVDGGGGGSVDYTKVVSKTESMPIADASNANIIYMYDGESDATYTHGYIYENVPTTTSSSATAAQTVGSSLSDIAVDLETLESFTGWTTDNSLQIFYTGDGWSVDTTSLGVTYTGTPSVGDAITITYTAAVTTYAWTRVDVQPAPVIPDPLPSQTGNAGKFLTTDGTGASWSDKPLVNSATGNNSLSVLGTATSTANALNIGVSSEASGIRGFAIGAFTKAQSNNCVAIGYSAQSTQQGGIAIGSLAKTTAIGAIQMAATGTTLYITNNDANTFKVANNNGNFEMMSADGTIPTDRLTNAINKYSTMPTAASTNEGWIVQFTGTTDASYTHGYIYECKAQGTNPETYAWEAVEVQASSGGGLQNTATGTNSLTILGTPNVYDTSVNIGVGSQAGSDSVAIGYNANDAGHGVVLGRYARSYGWGNNVVIGNYATSGTSSFDYSVIIGSEAKSANNVVNCIQLGGGTNPESNTFYVALNSNNYKLLGSDGSLPADRLASTTGLADGNYRLRLTMASGVPTLSWVAE